MSTILISSDTRGIAKPAGPALEGLKRVACNPALARLSHAHSVLLLQGPVGPFFDRLAAWLREGGTNVHRVAFHGGDRFDCREVSPIEFRAPPAQWRDALRHRLDILGVDCIVLFGQSRRHHRMAIEVANERGLPVVVMEEGYFRPGFVTMELGGVNGYSTTLSRYLWQPQGDAQPHQVVPLHPTGIEPHGAEWHFQKMALHAMRHYVALARGRDRFPDYEHHRNDEPLFYAAYWLRSWWRKWQHVRGDRAMQDSLFKGRRPYYLVPLQHDGDAQLTHHSRFGGNTDFIVEVIRSFAQNAPKEAVLVFRQHPHARGGAGHVQLIRALSNELGVEGRVVHLVEGDTPELAQHSSGVVVINSTVGLQAMERGAPLMVMGDAMYKQPGLTFAGPLDAFWTEARPGDRGPTEAFLMQIKNLTQAPASLYELRGAPLLWKRARHENLH